MIDQLVNVYGYSAVESACIAAVGNNWNSSKNCIKQLKIDLNKYFDSHQKEKCCYCGLLYDRTGRGEIEHIAPKGTNYYPQFTYTASNLAKVCQLCNSSSMKHVYDSIETVHANYNNCVFKIVHPYLDDHNLHYSWKYGVRKVTIAVANNSDKAKESIRLFELNSVKRTRARASQKNQERIDSLFNITDAMKQRIKQVMKFK